MPTLFGLFDDAKAAQKAADTLVAHGIAKDHVHVLTKADHAGLADLKNSLEADDVHFYTDSVNDGGTLLVVDALQKQVGDVAETLHKYGMVDVEHRAAEYAKKHGKKALREHQEEDYVLPVIEESLEVGKRAVERGRVRVYNRITERAVEEKVGLRDETIHVERRVVNRPVDITADLFQERSFEVVEIDEEAIVSKVARVIEEVVVSKEVAENIQTIKDTVRRSDVEIEKVAAVRTFDDFHGDFKTTSSTSSCLLSSLDTRLPTARSLPSWIGPTWKLVPRRPGKRRIQARGQLSMMPSSTPLKRHVPERKLARILCRADSPCVYLTRAPVLEQ